MVEQLREYFTQLRDLIAQLDIKAKIVIGVITGIVLVSLLLLIIRGADSNYQPLFQQLSADDAGEIVEELEARSVSYQLADNGKTILVPTENLHSMRLEMAAQGLPNQGLVGFEIFDETQFGTTNFERRVNLYRAMGGELSRSIQAMEGIELARVQITAPQESLFIDEETPAKASVMLQLESGFRLTQNQARAISNLVASSVPDLQPDKVTIVDTAGNLLTPNSSEGNQMARELTSSQRELEKEYEEELQRRLRTMLTRILGPDNFTVQVASRMNFDQRERESVTYLPVVGESGLPRSTQELSEVYYGGGAPEGGVPGTGTNVPGYMGTDEEDNSYYERTDGVTNYEMNEVIEREVFAPGTIENLSVSVMVNENLPEEELPLLEEAIQAAVNFDADRGDTINVASMAFDSGLEEEMAQLREQQLEAENRQRLIYAGLIIGVLIIGFIMVLIIRRRSRKESLAAGQGTRVDMTVSDEDEDVELPGHELTEEEKKVRKMKSELDDMVGDQPEQVAELLKSWLLED